MDRDRGYRHPGRDRFPRPRGDGPRKERRAKDRQRVSPPTRGWTCLRCNPLLSRLGFPAHAGMDRDSVRQDMIVTGFPRPRGDGPDRDRYRSDGTVVSPPTRGWTVDGASESEAAGGFPAHAGMDPKSSTASSACRRFPRPRGDGPAYGLLLDAERAVSPPTRGWTATRVPRRRSGDGFPAHAGMDPRDDIEEVEFVGFPRPRGDGPYYDNPWFPPDLVSPPTRGWTPRAGRTTPCHWGFPAHAGMDPPPSRSRCRSTWFPRPRGDGPQHPRSSVTGAEVSPPTRGWTGVLHAHR